jgi:hypothetical protein
VSEVQVDADGRDENGHVYAWRRERPIEVETAENGTPLEVIEED